jgi:hypothetical protein
VRLDQRANVGLRNAALSGHSEHLDAAASGEMWGSGGC